MLADLVLDLMLIPGALIIGTLRPSFLCERESGGGHASRLGMRVGLTFGRSNPPPNKGPPQTIGGTLFFGASGVDFHSGTAWQFFLPASLLVSF